jgi:hypothetical protein
MLILDVGFDGCLSTMDGSERGRSYPASGPGAIAGRLVDLDPNLHGALTTSSRRPPILLSTC